MCRLALINREGIDLIQKELGGIEYLFNYLEKSFGGHGNGLTMIFKDKSTKTIKGVTLSNKTIAKTVLDNLEDISYVFYHTRLASIGKVSDDNCHPFNVEGNVLLMNGTESQFQYNNSKTDTENILQLCVDNKMDLIKTVRKLKSVFLGYTKDKVFTVKNYGELKMIIDNKAVIFASEFPVIYFDKMTVFDAPDYWSNKKKVDLLSLKQAKYHEEYDWWQNYTYQTKFKKL